MATSRHDLCVSLYRSDFRAFGGFAFRELNPAEKLTGAWYVDLMADRLEGVAKGRIKRLIINAPPRTLKSLIGTVALAAFFLGRDPRRRVLLIAGHPSLGSDLMTKLRQLISSDRFRSIFPHMRCRMAGTTISTPNGGSIKLKVVGQQVSGHGADLIIVDDPLSGSRAQDDTARQEVNTSFDAEVMQRLNNRTEGALVLIMQRVHGYDLTGHLLNKDPGFTTLVLPSVATRDEHWILEDGRIFERRRGEILDPLRDSVEQQFKLCQQLGSYVYATQYLQNTCGWQEERATFRFEPKPANWSPGNSSLRGGIFRVTLMQKIMHGAFGHPLPEYANWPNEKPLTREEWKAAARIQQDRLVALCQSAPIVRPT